MIHVDAVLQGEREGTFPLTAALDLFHYVTGTVVIFMCSARRLDTLEA